MKLIFAGWCFVIVLFSFGIVSENDSYTKASNVSFFLPQNKTYSIEEVKKQSFEPLNKSILNSRTGYAWIKLTVPERAYTAGLQPVLFLASSELLQFVQAWYVNGSETIDLGACEPQFQIKECKLPGNQFAFPTGITEADAAGTEIYLYVKAAKYAFQNDLYFVTRPYFCKIRAYLDYCTGFSTGISFLIFALALLFYMEVKQRDFFIFAFYSLLTGIMAFINRGMWDAIRPINSTASAADIFIPLFFIARMVEIYFIKEYFKMRQNYKVPNMIMNVLIFLTFLGFLATYFPFAAEPLWSAWPHVVFEIPLIIVFVLGYLTIKKAPMAHLFFWAWGTGLFSYLIWGAFRLNLIEPHWIYGYAPIILRPVHFFLMTFVVFKSLNELNLELNFAKAREVEGNIVKTLLRTLAHDLANTTQIISASTNLALASGDPEKTKFLLQTTRDVISNQADVINNAKQNYLNRNCGQLLKLQMVNIFDCFDQAAINYENLINKKDLRIQNNLPPDINVYAETTSLTNHVLGNLFSNAIKFSKPGKCIELNLTTESNDSITVEFKDEGIGMPLETALYAFDSNRKVACIGTNGEESTGHGLLIVRDYMQYFSGKVNIKSSPGNGTSLYLTFKKQRV